MKKKNLIIGLIIVASLIIITLPFFLDSCINQDLNISSSLISAIASLTTMIIAILLYDKYGLKQSRVAKQTDIVIQFLSLIKDVRLWMHTNTSFLQYKPDSNLESVYELAYKTRLYFDDTYIKTISVISDFGYDINMPKSIATKIKVLKPYTMLPVEKDKVPDDCFIVTTLGLGKKQLIDKVFSRINDKELTFFDYHNIWIDIIDEAKEWLSGNQINVDELNIN